MRLIAIAVFILGLNSSFAADSKLTTLKTWFQHFKEGLSESAVSGQRQKRNVSAVAAVRGSQQESADPGKPQWKTGRKMKKSQQAKQEQSELAAAVDLIMAGQVKEGMAKLESFEKDHPKSPLLAEAKLAREKASELEKAAAEEPSTAGDTK